MKKFLTTLGLALLLLPQITGAEHLDMLLRQVQEVVDEDSTPTPAVTAFVAATLNDAKLTYTNPDKPLALTGEKVSAALASWKRSLPDQKLCSDAKLKTDFDCVKLMNEMLRIADREMHVVHLGHRIQSIATGYEEPVREFSIEPSKMNAAYQETLRVWGIPPLPQESGSLIRLMPIPNDATTLMEPLKNALASVGSKEEMIGAVWRYTYGLEHVRTAADAEIEGRTSGTERQYLFKRWSAVEENLETIRQELSGRIDPPLKDKEIALFLIPIDGQGEENITFWAHFMKEGAPTENLPKGNFGALLNQEDAGLRWDTALEPVFPSLLANGSEKAILGGKYPPPPRENADGVVLAEEGGGLCHTLSGSQGYLCRGRSALSELEECQEKAPNPIPSTIILSPCTPKPEEVEKGLGNVCEDMRKALPAGIKACENGTSVTYPYSILGSACFVRECAERTAEHDITPGRVPFVAQENAYPWSGCPIDPPAPRVLESPPSGIYPVIPPYNPAMRTKELDAMYCQGSGKPLLSPPVLCGPSLALAVSYPSIIDAAKGMKTTQDADILVTDDTVEAMEAMGLERGTGLVRDYLKQASDILGGNLKSVVAMLHMLAESKFPDTMCPLNPSEDRSVCSANSSASPQPK